MFTLDPEPRGPRSSDWGSCVKWTSRLVTREGLGTGLPEVGPYLVEEGIFVCDNDVDVLYRVFSILSYNASDFLPDLLFLSHHL